MYLWGKKTLFPDSIDETYIKKTLLELDENYKSYKKKIEPQQRLLASFTSSYFVSVRHTSAGGYTKRADVFFIDS